MSDIKVRPAVLSDLARLTEIYNHYVINTPITFDITPVTAAERVPWFQEHTQGGRYQLFVAEQDGLVLGYAGTGQFRGKAAYDPSVETTIYCAVDAIGKGIGSLMYEALFKALIGQDVHRALAGITMPNDASVALHRRFGFEQVALFTENGRKLGRYWDVMWMEKRMG